MALYLKCQAQLMQMKMQNGTIMIGCNGDEKDCPKKLDKCDVNAECFC